MSTHYAEASDSKLPTRGVIVRYSDRTLWGVDYEHHTYTVTNLSVKMEQKRGGLARTLKAEQAGMGAPRSAELQFMLSQLPGTATIGTFRLGSYHLVENGHEWRLWYAVDLPRPPADVQRGWAALLPFVGSSAAVATGVAGRVLARAEMRIGNSWKTMLNTENIRRITVKTADFAPPTAFKLVATTPSPGSDALSQSFGFALTAKAHQGPGPVMSNPELYVVFWGKALTQNPAPTALSDLMTGIRETVQPNYVKFVSQYGVDSAKVAEVYDLGGDPSRDVGGSNFAAVSATVYDIGFNHGGPLFWWEIGGHDPLYALFVAESSVDSSTWNGYHFLALSLTHLVLPFPISLFAHDGMPWLIVKVPDSALRIPFEGVYKRPNCTRGDPGLPSGLCPAIAALDSATERFSHEFIEASVDPYPFFGWSDPGKVPVWSKGELGDICEDNPLPWGKKTQVGITIVSTFGPMRTTAACPNPDLRSRSSSRKRGRCFLQLVRLY
jgi:hypothetical protein